MIRVADYIADYIYKLGIKDVFMVSGGGMMFLSDGLVVNSKINVVCNHHEQASAMAAETYSKCNENFGVAYITTGCGGTNAITGVLGAWQDSVPCLFISGQCKRKETIRNSGLKLRQFGVQEADIVSIVDSITKFAYMVNDPEMIAYYLEKAVYLSKSGRPGPVWLDIPMDVQGAQVDEKKLKHFKENDLEKGYKENVTTIEIKKVTELINKSARPVIIAGNGIGLAGAKPIFKEFIEKTRIPVVVPHLGINNLPTGHKSFIGRIGNKGDRSGNLAVQNSDLVLSLGSSLSVSSTGQEYQNFAREAKIIVVDIDPVQHLKNTIRIDLFVNADIKKFLEELNGKELNVTTNDWQKKCSTWKEKYPVCLPEYKNDKNGINLYYFVDRLSKKMKSNAIVISDAGSAFYAVSQGIILKSGQRFITSGGQAEMGYTLPATIGASVSMGRKEVIGITGDGSLQMNIQELQTVKHYKLPIKLFVWNNNGYLSIRATQTKFFNGRYIGTDKASGVSFPDLKKIASAYGIKYYKISKSSKIDECIDDILLEKEAVICEVMCDPNQEIVPSVQSLKKQDGTMVSKPLEDMYPFLDRNEFSKEMIVKPLGGEDE